MQFEENTLKIMKLRQGVSILDLAPRPAW